MDLVIGNPLGLWALAALPVVALIHFLQRRSKQQTISTLFLLDRMRRESVSGRTFERLRSSIPLWLQWLGVLLLTWMLINPRCEQQQVVQRVAVILDGSASMTLAKSAAREALERELIEYQKDAHTLEIVIIDSDLRHENLYLGTSIDASLAAFDLWEPHSGTHSFTPALRAARSLVGPEGALLLISDHALDESLSYEARFLTVGQPSANVGLAGMSVQENEGQMVWQVLARNYSDDKQTRQWWLEVGQDRTDPVDISLDPDESRMLTGAFPNGSERCIIALSNDAFTLDDRLPIVVPKAKTLTLTNHASDQHRAFYGSILSSYSDLERTTDSVTADVHLWSIDPDQSDAGPDTGIVSVADPLPIGGFIQGRIVVENHSLVEDLNWQTLLCRESVELPKDENDAVLVWCGDRPLIWLRPDTHQLIFNFDLTRSNVSRLPAFVVLIHRYLEEIRTNKVAFERRNDEIAQLIPVAVNSPGAPLQLLSISVDGQEETRLAERLNTLLLPRRPSFYQVFQGDEQLIEGAVYFADAREADFRKASSGTDGTRSGTARETTVGSSDDAPWRFGLILLALTLLISWKFTRDGVPAPEASRT